MNTLQRISALFLLIITSVITAHAAGEWIEIGEQDGVKYSIYSKITKENDYKGSYVVWIMSEYNTQAARARMKKHFKLQKTPFSQKVCYKYNSSFTECSLVSSVIYSSKGSVIDSFNASYDDFEQIVPGTLGEWWAEMAHGVLMVYGE